MWWDKHTLKQVAINLTRDELIRRSRILVIDDEKPALIQDLQKAGFAVDYEPDITKENMKILEAQQYDLILLDFGNIGNEFGKESGLSLLKHIKRVNPVIVILAYTSKSLDSNHADFYRLTDGVLPKDAGIADSLEKVEKALYQAHSSDHVWKGLLAISKIEAGSKTDKEWQHLFVQSLSNKNKLETLKDKIKNVIGSETAQKLGIALIVKLFEVAAKHLS